MVIALNKIKKTGQLQVKLGNPVLTTGGFMRGRSRMGNERGIVLIIALMLLLVLTILGITSSDTGHMPAFHSILPGAYKWQLYGHPLFP